MTSKIREEIEKATGLSQEKGESQTDYYKRLAKGVQGLDNKAYNALSKEADKWFNDVCDAVEADPPQPLPAFPDEQEEERPRRRSRDEADDKPKAYEPKEGDKVTVTTKRGKIYADVTFVQYDKVKGEDVLVLKDKEGEFETPAEGAEIKSAEAPKEETTSRRRSRDEAEEPSGDPKVGDTIEVTNKRGKVYTGILKEDQGDVIVLELLGGDVEDLDKSRLDKVVIKHRAAASGSSKSDDKGAAKEETTSRRRSSGSDDKDKGDAKAGSDKGPSVTTRVAELVIENPDASAEKIAEMIKKEGLACRDNTLDMNYKSTHKILKLLRDRKMLK